jgi:SAM-dependent methyltransferase
MTANEDQIKFWNDRAGRDWTDLQQVMDRILSGIHGPLMAFAAPKAGEHVLDIGCGTGTTTMALADAVGAGGVVTGLDISEPMLGLARERAQGRANMRFVLADASAHPFVPEYDLLFSRFGVMFFDDPPAAFANLRRALKPGGRLAFVCWRALADNPWASVPLAAGKPFLPEMPPSDPLAPGPFAFADAVRVRSILEAAGFSGIDVALHDNAMNLGTDLGFAAAMNLRIGPLSRAAAEADEPTRAKILEAVNGALASFVAGNGVIAPPAACWLVAARA